MSDSVLCKYVYFIVDGIKYATGSIYYLRY